MIPRFFNLTLMAFWLAILAGLLTREVWMPALWLEKINRPQTPLVMVLAGVLAAWNLSRFWAARRPSGPTKASPIAEEYRRKIRAISEDDPMVTDPQFNFEDSPPKSNL